MLRPQEHAESRKDFPAERHHTEFSGLAPTRQCKPAKHNVPGAELNDSIKAAVRNRTDRLIVKEQMKKLVFKNLLVKSYTK